MKLSENAMNIVRSRYAMDEYETWQQLCLRVGREAARFENGRSLEFTDKFAEIIFEGDFIPGGRILRNMGRPRGSLFNCYVIPVGDSRKEIGKWLSDSLELWGEGGGVGCNLSFLRPRGAPIKGVGGNSSGPVSFLEASDAVAKTVESGGSRRAAALACMIVTHPDILEFIDAKITHGKLPHYNISVAVTEEFLEAVEQNAEWEFRFAHQSYGMISARLVWNKIMENMVKHAEPGLLNWDNLRSNNSYYFDPILATNPCGEVPLPAYGVCCLGSLVLPNFITGNVNTNWKKLEQVIKLAVRFLDNIIDVNKYTLPEVDVSAHNGRRIGLGVMGLAEYLFAKKVRYGSKKALDETERLIKFIRDIAYEASVELAVEKGAFPKFDPVQYGKAHFIRSLPAQLRMAIKDKGIRNVTLMAMAPTGCQEPNTLVITDSGILSLNEIGDLSGDKWQNINIKAIQENLEERRATKFFNNGMAETKKIYLSSGITLEATYNHQYRVLNGKEYLWKRADELEVGDNIIAVIGSYNKQTNPPLIMPPTSHFNQHPINIINEMNDKLAEFLGIYYGDGSNHDKGIRIACNAHDDEWLYVKNLGEEVFGISPTIENNGRGCISVCFNSTLLLQFLKINGLLKSRSNALSIPKCIRMSSSSAIRSFIKGIIFADGSGEEEYEQARICTASETFAKQLLIIIRALGNNAKLDTFTSGLGSKIYRIYIHSKNYKFRSKNIQNQLALLDSMGLSNCIVDVVVGVEDSKNFTCDIEVPDTVTYIANSVVSHNTISLIPEVSSGIEPLFSKAYRRNDRIGERLYVHPTYAQIINSGEETPEWFVDSNDLKPSDHLEMQAIVQKYTDGAVSKTINMPAGTTPEDLSRMTLEYIRDLKGVTVYVDGSREGQVLNKVTDQEVRNYLKSGSNVAGADEESVRCASGTCEL